MYIFTLNIFFMLGKLKTILLSGKTLGEDQAVAKADALCNSLIDVEDAVALLLNEVKQGRIKSRIEGATNPVYQQIKNIELSISRGQTLRPDKVAGALYSAGLAEKEAAPIILFSIKDPEAQK